MFLFGPLLPYCVLKKKKRTNVAILRFQLSSLLRWLPNLSTFTFCMHSCLISPCTQRPIPFRCPTISFNSSKTLKSLFWTSHKPPESRSIVSDSLWAHGLYSPLYSPGQNTEEYFPFSRDFPTQGSNPGLTHCGKIVYQLSHQGSPIILEWLAL